MYHAYFDIAFPLSFINNYSTTPRGTTPEFLVFCGDFIVRVNAYPRSMSLLMAFSSAAEFSSEWDGLWFPLISIVSRSDFRISSSIG